MNTLANDLSPLFISLRTALLATVITFFCGIFAGNAVRKMNRFKGFVDGIFTLPLVLPPTVVGFFLLLLIGRNSWLGQILSHLRISLVFSWSATVISASVVAFPLMYRTARGAFEQIDPNIVHAARTLGLTEGTIFWRVILPNSWPGITAGTVLAFARALGEFGATIMIAGNIPGKTQTMAMAIYAAVQAGDRDLAFSWSLVTIAISATVILALNFWNGYQGRAILRTARPVSYPGSLGRHV